jgi:hypothetical protein
MSGQEDLNRQIANSMYDLPMIPKKETKFVTDDEIKDITMRKFPMFLRVAMFLFKACHWTLLFSSILQLINRRYNEFEDVTRIEQPDVEPEVRARFYQLTGIIYAKYNLEILNFIFYLLLVSSFHRLSGVAFTAKMLLEALLGTLIAFKVYRYLIELAGGDNSKMPITMRHIVVEMAVFGLHVVIVAAFMTIYCGFHNNRQRKNIYRVHYLGKKIKRAAAH